MGVHQETAEDYAHMIAVIDRWRLVRCKDDLQFIVQERARGAAKWPWRARAYVMNVTALPAALHRASLGIPPDAVAAMIHALSAGGS